MDVICYFFESFNAFLFIFSFKSTTLLLILNVRRLHIHHVSVYLCKKKSYEWQNVLKGDYFSCVYSLMTLKLYFYDVFHGILKYFYKIEQFL